MQQSLLPEEARASILQKNPRRTVDWPAVLASSVEVWRVKLSLRKYDRFQSVEYFLHAITMNSGHENATSKSPLRVSQFSLPSGSTSYISITEQLWLQDLIPSLGVVIKSHSSLLLYLDTLVFLMQGLLYRISNQVLVKRHFMSFLRTRQQGFLL